MEKGKNKYSGLIVLVIILCLLVLGLGGYIIYDKVLSEKTKEPTNNDIEIVTNNANSGESNKDIFTYSSDSEYIMADFKVVQIGELFVIYSYEKGKQCYPNNVTIINGSGDIIKKFENVQFSYENNEITIESSNNGQCMGPDVVFSKTEYVVNGTKLIEQ